MEMIIVWLLFASTNPKPLNLNTLAPQEHNRQMCKPKYVKTKVVTVVRNKEREQTKGLQTEGCFHFRSRQVITGKKSGKIQITGDFGNLKCLVECHGVNLNDPVIVNATQRELIRVNGSILSIKPGRIILFDCMFERIK